VMVGNLAVDIGATTAAEKLRSYLEEHIVYGIRAIKETLTSISVLTTPNSLVGLHEQMKSSAARIFYNAAVSESANFVELTLLCVGAGRTFNKHKVFKNKDSISGFVAYMLQRIRARKPTPATIVHLYDISNNETFGSSGTTLAETNKDRLFTEEWIGAIENTVKIPIGGVEEPNGKETASF